MMPNSPWLCLKSSRVKLTAAAEAPAFDIWSVRHLTSAEPLTQAALAVLTNCGVICQTAVASIFADPGCDCATRHSARQITANIKPSLHIFPSWSHLLNEHWYWLNERPRTRIATIGTIYAPKVDRIAPTIDSAS